MNMMLVLQVILNQLVAAYCTYLNKANQQGCLYFVVVLQQLYPFVVPESQSVSLKPDDGRLHFLQLGVIVIACHLTV